MSRPWVPAFALLALVLLIAPPPAELPTRHAPSPPILPATTGIPAPAVVQTSTAGQTFHATQTWNQTGTTLYAGHSTGWSNFTFNPGGIITSVFTTTATFSVAPPGTNIARVLVTQGAKTLANTTSNLFTVTPSVSSTAVTERIVAMTNATGAAPAQALYACTTVVTESVQFDVVSPSGNWTYNNTTYRTHWYVNASHGYWLNSTAVSIPLVPNAVVNITSLAVTVNNSAATYQLTTNSAYVLLGPIPSGTSDQVVITYRPVPTILTKPPTLYFDQFSDHDGLYTGEYFYTDYPVPAYNGLYLLQVNFSSPITNVTVSANGAVFPARTVSISDNLITILPGAFTTYQAVQVLFMVTFNAAPAVAGLPGNSLVLLSNNVTTITLGELLWLAVFVTLAYLIVAVYTMPGHGYRHLFERRRALAAWGYLWEPLFVLFVLALFLVLGTLAG